MKFTEDELDKLDVAITQEYVKPLLRVLEQCVINIEEEVLKTTLTDSQSQIELVYKKCRADGARKLLNSFKQSLGQLRKKKETKRVAT